MDIREKRVEWANSCTILHSKLGSEPGGWVVTIKCDNLPTKVYVWCMKSQYEIPPIDNSKVLVVISSTGGSPTIIKQPNMTPKITIKMDEEYFKENYINEAIGKVVEVFEGIVGTEKKANVIVMDSNGFLIECIDSSQLAKVGDIIRLKSVLLCTGMFDPITHKKFSWKTNPKA